MSSYAEQAEREMWDAATAAPAPRLPGVTIAARYHGRCDGCGGPVRRGDAIRYVRAAPRGNRVYCVRECGPTA